MASMLRDVASRGSGQVNVDALKSEIRQALINQKANACPIAVRLAWHSSGTYNKSDKTGGSNGATMRFEPESTDPDNAGLGIVRDLLLPIKEKFPQVSFADLYTLAGTVAVEFLGGPKIPFNFGRGDDANGARCPANGRLPDATQGAAHLRDVFGRMGFNDQEIVALSGGHTLGRCHGTRSGFDGPWTTHPLRFDNQYYVNLIKRKWVKRQWSGPPQFEDAESGKLMMLISDLALIEDPKFRVWVEKYANDEKLFFEHFSEAFSKLLSLGCPAEANPNRLSIPQLSPKQKASAEFRELAMHGSVEPAQKILAQCDPHELEATSGRSALHKAAFWGHNDMTTFLLKDVKLNPNVQDCFGDTALHDAAKFGHEKVVSLLIQAGANPTLKNAQGLTPVDLARKHEKSNVLSLLTKSKL